jgi:hypothetical protein
MRNLSYIILFLISFSCKENILEVKGHFDFIEITNFNGWTGGSTVQIDSLGIIKKCNYHIISHIDSAICCIDTLDYKIIDTLNVMIDKLKFESIDTLYDGHCEDCGGYFINIGFDNKTIKSMIIGRNKFVNNISKFAVYVSHIMIDKNQIDSVIVFETTKFMIPPPPPAPDSIYEK